MLNRHMLNNVEAKTLLGALHCSGHARFGPEFKSENHVLHLHEQDRVVLQHVCSHYSSLQADK